MEAEEAPSTNLQKQMTAPLVSIIMPCYRVSQYIRDALDSVLSQTFSNYEIIIVNDGSPDTKEFEKALQPYMEKVIYIRQDNRGYAGARNTGIRVARGKYLALLDPDDIWENNYIEIQVSIVLHKAECTMNLTLMEHAAIKCQKLYFRALQELYEGKNSFFFRENPQRQLKGLRKQTNSFRAVNYGGRAFFYALPFSGSNEPIASANA